jgi:hypothetical protein
MLVRRFGGRPGRILLIGLAAWALLMIAPDLYRVVDPLASAGFAADNDGRIYDVRGPFAQEADSPAWNAGLRVGDRIDLMGMRCAPPRGAACATLLSVLGGMGGTQLVRPGRVLALAILPAQGGAAQVVTVAAKRPPVGMLDRFVLLLSEIAGIAFVSAAAWLVWTRPGAMTWGFFLYAFWFNPGQNFVYFLTLQEHPQLMLAQGLADSLAHGAACAGFLLFALRVPGDQSERRWRNVLRVLPAIGVGVASLQLMSLLNVFGYSTETISRATFLADYGVDGLAVWILLRRRHGQPPQDFQRMRWVIWGCLIGLPAYILSGIVQSTSLWQALWNEPLPRSLAGILLLVYGILGWFVFEAVRRPRVVSVSIPLRRITVFGLMLSVPSLFAHQQLEHLELILDLPYWAWIAVASALLFLISRVHELAAELADHVFNRTFRRRTAQLVALGQKILQADSVETIERLLTEGPRRQLRLASAAVFRRTDDATLRRHAESQGWRAAIDSVDLHDAALSGVAAGRPFPIDASDATRLGFPAGLAAPTVAVPVRDRLRCFAVTLYGPHQSGEDLAVDERAMLGRLADDAALAYARAETEALRRQVAALELRLSETGVAS